MSRNPSGIFNEVFAETGDTAVPPFPINEGWPSAYSSSLYPRRTTFNYLYKQLYALGVDINSMGACLEWDSTIDYDQYAYVSGSDGNIYRAVISNTGNNPVGDSGANWVSLSETLNITTTPVGTINAYASNGTIPEGFLLCDGSAISRASYADLFAIIGITWGAGDGTSTFNIPDLRGKFLRGFDNGRGIDPARVFASSQDDAFQGFSPVGPDAFGISSYPAIDKKGAQYYNNGGGTLPNNITNWDATSLTIDSHTFSSLFISEDEVGGFGVPRLAKETRPLNLSANFIIKY